MSIPDDYTGAAVWYNQDHDEPVMVTGYAGEHDGVRYFTVAGSATSIPEGELRVDSLDPLLNAALEYARRGWPVFPCEGKKPLTPHGFQDASANALRIRYWWRRWPRANIGIPTGAKTFTVLDVDGRNGGDDTLHELEAEHGSLPTTPHVITGSGGSHYWFRSPTVPITSRAGALGPGLDVKADGGYVIVPPSVHPNTGAEYVWDVMAHVEDMPLAEMPPWMVAQLEATAAEEAPERPTDFTLGSDVAPAARALERLAQWRCDDYHAWVEVGMALSELGSVGLALWEEWSKQSAKYAAGACQEKWGTFKAGNGRTLASLMHWAEEDQEAMVGAVSGNKPTATAPAPDSTESDDAPPPGTPTPVATAKRKHVAPRNPKTADYIAALASLGYSFRMNLCGDEIEVNGRRLDDPLEACIRSQLRDIGYPKVNVARDAYVAEAWEHRYHPVLDYLDSLSWDGADHIGMLAAYIESEPPVMGAWLRRWLIGAVARARLNGVQNRMLVLEGAQALGKSFFARWLCSPLPEMHYEAPIDPTDKDSDVRLMSMWIWEVAELGATTRKADRESLKHFISKESVRVRKAYGRYDTVRPALASFIGTVNNESGFLSDPTGYRRFMVAPVKRIDWSYTTDINVHQVWAQANALFQGGESWNLTPDEGKRAEELSERFEAEDYLEDRLDRLFVIDPTDTSAFLTTDEIIMALDRDGTKESPLTLAKRVAAILRKRELSDGRDRPKSAGGKQKRGWYGISHRQSRPTYPTYP